MGRCTKSVLGMGVGRRQGGDRYSVHVYVSLCVDLYVVCVGIDCGCHYVRSQSCTCPVWE